MNRLVPWPPHRLQDSRSVTGQGMFVTRDKRVQQTIPRSTAYKTMTVYSIARFTHTWTGVILIAPLLRLGSGAGPITTSRSPPDLQSTAQPGGVPSHWESRPAEPMEENTTTTSVGGAQHGRTGSNRPPGTVFPPTGTETLFTTFRPPNLTIRSTFPTMGTTSSTRQLRGTVSFQREVESSNFIPTSPMWVQAALDAPPATAVTGTVAPLTALRQVLEPLQLLPAAGSPSLPFPIQNAESRTTTFVSAGLSTTLTKLRVQTPLLVNVDNHRRSILTHDKHHGKPIG